MGEGEGETQWPRETGGSLFLQSPQGGEEAPAIVKGSACVWGGLCRLVKPCGFSRLRDLELSTIG